MLVSSLDHAAQAVYADAEARVYDDVGCLATDADSRNGTYRFYVHTRDGRWTEVGKARFVHDNEVSTPMSYGLVALTDAEAARQRVPVRTWNEIVAELEEERR
jgi:copper chaperone NosL